MYNFPICLVDKKIIFHLNAFFKSLEASTDTHNNQYNNN